MVKRCPATIRITIRMREISNPRLLAFEVLTKVEIEGLYSNIVLPQWLGRSKLSREDKALATELVYGSLRMRGRHDSLISKVSNRPLAEIEEKVLICVRLGVHQLTQMRIPSHAAIFETVEIAKRAVGKSSGSFVNALLRSIDSLNLPKNAVDEENIEYLTAEYSHPEWIISSYFDSLKSRAEVIKLLQANNAPTSPNLIAWPGLSTVDELISAGAEPIPNSHNGAIFNGNPGDIPAIRERRAGVQDYGSQIVVEKFLDTFEEDLKWLDMCAGPGGKSAYLSAYINQHSGDFVANEISEHRAELVNQVVKNHHVTQFDARRLPESLGDFDRILLDAPCTGIGALRRRPEVRWRRSLEDLKSLTQLQTELLDAAAARLTVDGILAYVTCSSHQAETTFQIRAFLKRHSHFQRIRVNDARTDTLGDLQLWTHRDSTDCMYLSLLRRVK